MTQVGMRAIQSAEKIDSEVDSFDPARVYSL